MPLLHGNFYSDKHLWGCADRFDGRRPLIDVAPALPFDKWCPRAQILHKKKNEWKNSMEMLFCLQNYETYKNFLLMEGTWNIIQIKGSRGSGDFGVSSVSYRDTSTIIDDNIITTIKLRVNSQVLQIRSNVMWGFRVYNPVAWWMPSCSPEVCLGFSIRLLAEVT